MDAYIAGRHRVADPFILVVDAKAAIESGIVIKHAGTTVYLTKDVPETFLSRLDDEQMEQLKSQDMEEEKGLGDGKDEEVDDQGSQAPEDDGSDLNDQD